MEIDDQITRLAWMITRQTRLTVLTGAGVSAASGVPTFRGAQGLWRNYSPQELATLDAFRRDPTLVWEWYSWRREVISKCKPNAAHEVLAAWSRRYPGFTLVTQNVDGLHEKAGTENVIRFHGSIWEMSCLNRCSTSPARWPDDTVPLPKLPPCCPYCGGLARPGVVWFGEGIDPAVLARSTDALDCDIFMAIGTSAVVYPAAGLVQEASSLGVFTVEINPETSAMCNSVRLALQGPAEVILQKLEERLLRNAV